MVLTETGRNVFDGICEDGRIGIEDTLLEDGRRIVEVYSSLIVTLLQSKGGVFKGPWPSGHTFQKKCTVIATTAGAQTNYQLELLIGESDGAVGAGVHCNRHCQNFPNDIRFTKEDGITKHDYWVDTSSLEGTTPNRKVSVLIEVASIPASGSVDFFMYYGKSGDVGESNCSNTFPFSDDFKRTDKPERYFEDFLDTYNEESKSNIGYSVYKPTKYASNPVFSGGTWDEDKYYVHVDYIDSKYKMWYGAVDASANLHCCYAESVDGYSWTRPTLGLINYGGNTNNNILLPEDIYAPSIYYDANASNPDRKYILQSPGERGKPSGSDQHIYFSPDGKNFTFGKTIYGPNPESTGHMEAVGIQKLEDGSSRWISYYQRYHSGTALRATGAQISKTSDPMGEWQNFGVLVPEFSVNNQMYSNGVTYKDGRYYSFTTRYNKSTENIELSLWVSRNGLTWLQADSLWIPRGGSGDWDECMIFDGETLIKVGNEWWFYYAGSKYNHAHSLPRQSHIGIAKIDYRRIGSIHAGGTEGTFISKNLFTLNSLKMNGNASGGGTIKLELLDTNGDPIVGYTKADFDTITTNGYDFTPAWSSITELPVQPVKLKFYLENSYLYSYLADCSNIHYIDNIENLRDEWIEQPDNSSIQADQILMTKGEESNEWYFRKLRHTIADFSGDVMLEAKMQTNVTNAWGYLNFMGADLKHWHLAFSPTAELCYLNATGGTKFDSYNPNESRKFSILFHNTANTADYYVDDVLIASDQAGYLRSAWRIIKGEVSIGSHYSIPQTLKADWIYIRKYASPEPTWGSWGAEEEGQGRFLMLKLLQAKNINMKLSHEKLLNMKLSQKQQKG